MATNKPKPSSFGQEADALRQADPDAPKCRWVVNIFTGRRATNWRGGGLLPTRLRAECGLPSVFETPISALCIRHAQAAAKLSPGIQIDALEDGKRTLFPKR